MDAMGLTLEQITNLSLTIETGQLHTEYDTCDMKYGSDPRLSEIFKQRRKTGLDSLSKFIEAKDASGICVHFTSVIRDLNDEGRSTEVSVVTGWFMEARRVYQKNETGFVNYVKDYLRRYRWPCLPVQVRYGAIRLVDRGSDVGRPDQRAKGFDQGG